MRDLHLNMIDEVKGTIFDADQQLGKCQIPLTKVKRLMKEDDDTKSVGADVTYLVALATVGACVWHGPPSFILAVFLDF